MSEPQETGSEQPDFGSFTADEWENWLRENQDHVLLVPIDDVGPGDIAGAVDSELGTLEAALSRTREALAAARQVPGAALDAGKAEDLSGAVDGLLSLERQLQNEVEQQREAVRTMSDPDTNDDTDRTDTVVETYESQEMGVTAKECLRTGHDGEEHEFVKVYGSRTERYGALDGGGETEVERDVKLAEFPEDVTTEVLFGLAELHGYRLEAK